MSGQAGRDRGFGDHGLGHRRGRGQGAASRSCCAAARRRRADAMVAGLEKSLAKQVERGQARGRRARPRCSAGSARSPTSASSPTATSCIESIVEDLAAKKHLFTELDRICADHTILATNTSTLPVVEMAMDTGRPDKVCGIHFFNPAPMMALVEVVRAITTSDETIDDGHGVRRRRAARTRCRSRTRPGSS